MVARDRGEATVVRNVHANNEHCILRMLKFLADLWCLLGSAQDVRHQQYPEGYHDLAVQLTVMSIFVACLPGLGMAGTGMARKLWADIVGCVYLAVPERPPRLAHFPEDKGRRRWSWFYDFPHGGHWLWSNKKVLRSSQMLPMQASDDEGLRNGVLTCTPRDPSRCIQQKDFPTVVY